MRMTRKWGCIYIVCVDIFDLVIYVDRPRCISIYLLYVWSVVYIQ